MKLSTNRVLDQANNPPEVHYDHIVIDLTKLETLDVTSNLMISIFVGLVTFLSFDFRPKCKITRNVVHPLFQNYFEHLLEMRNISNN